MIGQVITVFIEGINNLINNVGTGQLDTVNIVSSLVSVPAVSNRNTVHIGLAIGMHTVEQLAANALQHTVGYLEIVTLSLGNGTPVNHGATVVTVGSASVAIGQTGYGLIFHFGCGVSVPAGGRYGCSHSSFHIERTVKGTGGTIGKDHSALADICLHINQRIAVTANLAGFKTGAFSIPGPYTNGNADQCCSTGGCFTDLSHGNGCHIMILVERIGGFKAIRNDHVIQLPGIGKVKIHVEGYGIDVLQYPDLDICIVHRIILGHIVQIIMAFKDNGCSTINRESGALLHHVTHVIGNLEGNGMGTGGQGYIGAADGGAIAGNTIECNTVHIDLGRSKIQTGCVACRVVSNFCGEGSDSSATDADQQIADHRSISVVHCITVAQSNVVDIEYSVEGLLGLGVETDELRLSAVRNGLIGILNCHIIVSRQIHIAVYPAILGDVCFRALCQCLAIALQDQVGILTGIAGGRSTTIQLSLHCKIVTGCKLFGDVDPHTQLGCIFTVGNITKDGLTTDIEEHVVRPLAKGTTVGIVQFHTKRVLTILHLTILSGCQEGGGVITCGEVVSKGSSIKNRAVGVIHGCPLYQLISAQPVRNVTVFEVIQDFRTLAEGNIQRGGSQICILIGCRNPDTGLGGIVGSSKLQAVSGTCGFIGHSPLEVICGINHLQLTVHGLDIQFDTLAIGNYRARLRESHAFGIDDMDALGTDNLLIVDQLDCHITGLAIGSEHTIRNGTEAGISQSPGCLGGDLSLSTGEVTANCLYINGGIGNIVIAFSLQISIIKLTGCGCGGNKDNAVGVLTQCAITGRAVHGKLFTGALGHEGGGTAAVTVGRIDTAGSNHDLCTLVHVHAQRIGRLTTIVHHDNNRTVCLNTNHRTGCGVRTMAGCVLVHAILDNVAGGTGNDLIFPAVQRGTVGNGSHFDLGNVGRSCLPGIIGILMDDDTGGEAHRMIKINLAVNHHKAQRFIDAGGIFCIGIRVIPAQAGIHRAHNIFAPFIFNKGGMFRNGGNRIIGGIHLSVAADYPGIGIGDIRFHQMNDLTSVTSCIIQDNFGFLNTGCDIPIIFTDDVVVVIAAVCFVMGIIICSKRREGHGGNNTQYHHESKQK